MNTSKPTHRLGEPWGTKTLRLRNSETAGEKVLRVVENADSYAGAALVQRGSNPKEPGWDWKPVRDDMQLYVCLANHTPEFRSENVGFWTDKRRWLVFPPDGEIQEDEVTTLGQTAQSPALVKSETSFNEYYGHIGTWASHYAATDVAGVKVDTGSAPALHLPQVITQSTIEDTTTWGLSAAVGWVPEGIHTSVYRLENQ